MGQRCKYTQIILMTYLFIIIALPVMNSILISNGDLAQLLAANGAIVSLLYLLEKDFGFHFEQSKKITYEKIELITPENYTQLLADLQQRTGLPIKRAEVGRLDFLRDMAEIKIFFDEPAPTATPAEIGERESYLLRFQ